ncbi:MAG TPA: helix-turn-helix domain-containing protein [Rhabdochlamydiaceae bacterium]
MNGLPNEREKEKKFVTLSEAAKINNVTRQAIYVAIKQKKLRAYKNPTRWIIDLDDLADYRKMKYSREKSVHNGELLYDNKKGFFSIQQASKMLNIPYQKVYYATRIGLMKAVRKGSAWVIHIDDIKNYQNTYLNRLISNLDSGVASS